MFASENGRFQLAKLLLKEKADPKAHSKEGWTALMFASQNGHLQIVELLLMENADPNDCGSTGWTALLLASKNGHSNVVVMLLHHKAELHVEIYKHLDSFTIASVEGNTDVVKPCLNHAEITFESLSMGWYYACHFGHVPALQSNRVNIVCNQTDIIISCAEGHTDIVRGSYSIWC